MGPEWIVVGVIAVAVLFGAKKIPEMARSVGRAQGEFKRGIREGAVDETGDTQPSTSQATQSQPASQPQATPPASQPQATPPASQPPASTPPPATGAPHTATPPQQPPPDQPPTTGSHT